MLYLDTSLIVAALTREAKTIDVQDWLLQNVNEQIAISDWRITEFSSAFAIKLRSGHLTLDQRTSALAAFRRLIAAA